jgi:hypothetical protein
MASSSKKIDQIREKYEPLIEQARIEITQTVTQEACARKQRISI